MPTHRLDLTIRTACGSREMLRPAAVGTLPLPTSSLRGVPLLRTLVRSFRFPDPVVPDGSSSETLPGAARSGRKRAAQTLPDAFPLRDRLYYALQPPIEAWLQNGLIPLPMEPFPYQAQGIAFLVPRSSALLGDEMGLGKTMQAIVATRVLLGTGLARRVLVVCPKPLVTNWVREFETWAGDVPTLIVEGSTRKRHALWEVPQVPVKIVNYELLSRDYDFLRQMQQEFDLVVIDEAQRIKNEHSQTARAVRSLSRRRSWALTGTPLENRPEDLVSIFSFVQPGLLEDVPTLARLREQTEPFLLRRKKEQVLTQLPPKFVRDTQIDLTAAQRESYAAAEQDGVLRLNELGDAITIQNVFELVLRLKQICNFDPATGESAKLEQLRTDMEEIAASGRKALIFSQWVSTLERLGGELADYCPLAFHGGVPSAQRGKVLERFRDDPNCHALLLTYGAGSVGLNLQFAQYVFLFDRWWNPAVEDQAINRVHRVGQTEPVFITRFVTTGTIEERIIEVLDHKRALINAVVPGTDAPRSLSLVEEDVFRLFDIQARPRRALAA